MPNDRPLKPDDFPVEVEGEKLVTADGKPIAKAKTPVVAEDIADRLNEDDYRKEQDHRRVARSFCGYKNPVHSVISTRRFLRRSPRRYARST
jgi:hypothetical protein